MPPTDPRTGSSGSRPCQSPPPERLKAGRRWQGADEPGSRSERAKAPPHGARQRCAVDLRPRSRACRCRVDRRGRARQGGAGAASRGIGVRLRRRREMPLGPRAVSPLSPDRERAYSANNRSKVVLSTVKLGPPNSTKLDYRQYPSPEHTRHSFTSGEVSACFHFSGVMSNYAGGGSSSSSAGDHIAATAAPHRVLRERGQGQSLLASHACWYIEGESGICVVHDDRSRLAAVSHESIIPTIPANKTKIRAIDPQQKGFFGGNELNSWHSLYVIAVISLLKAYPQALFSIISTYGHTYYPELNGDVTDVSRSNDNRRCVATVECEASMPFVVASRGADSHREPVAPLDDSNRKQAIASRPVRGGEGRDIIAVHPGARVDPDTTARVASQVGDDAPNPPPPAGVRRSGRGSNDQICNGTLVQVQPPTVCGHRLYRKAAAGPGKRAAVHGEPEVVRTTLKHSLKFSIVASRHSPDTSLEDITCVNGGAHQGSAIGFPHDTLHSWI